MILSRTLPSTGAAVALAAALGWGLASLGTAAPFAAAAQEAETQDGTENAVVVEEMRLGDPDAEVTVIEYASFTCPHCATFHDTVFDDLKENYIDTGEINFVHREVFFDRFGLWAAMVARCGGEERYFGIAEMLYDQQSEWVQGDQTQIATNLRRIGRTAGLSEDQLESCLTDTAMAEALVENYTSNAEADEITATPSFVIDGTTYGNMSYEEFAEILDEQLAE